ncbi:hypothetical protein HYPBUDRAFT_151517 [Hyphopichia burtonii NRRL Y-1933]|uniref:Uncharacterized protein n=1 Tax=Hyphopichia burtonii NRRL Y-1933 TaxID=984485 RepID=A0A1E4RS35_9ASCO|nr:hypothetical protein HYPBUDRAFT_151517 [Hyphopichia burtonii NRRL Y-1933]ODV70001.1 hypothetical protein HYPBUDRAFT_151517 [Hyphopichia burtonii NRRL Y-1933]
MAVPTRRIKPEPFSQQLDMIEKHLIELQTQPLKNYTKNHIPRRQSQVSKNRTSKYVPIQNPQVAQSSFDPFLSLNQLDLTGGILNDLDQDLTITNPNPTRPNLSTPGWSNGINQNIWGTNTQSRFSDATVWG